jgi:hypothetical protein
MEMPITSILGGDNPKYVSQALIGMRNALAPLKAKAYSPDLAKISFKVGVSGTIHKFEGVPDGPSNIKFFPKKREVLADITVHDPIWKQGEKAFAAFVAESIRKAVEEAGPRLGKAKIDFPLDAFLADLDAALKPFLTDR